MEGMIDLSVLVMGRRRSTDRSFCRMGRKKNHLLLNVATTKEMVIDFRRKRMASLPKCIVGEDVDVLADYRYLGIYINNRLNW